MTLAQTLVRARARSAACALTAMLVVHCAGDSPQARVEGPAGLAVQVAAAEGVVLDDVELDLFGQSSLDVERLAGELPLDDGLRLFVEVDRTVTASWAAADGARREVSVELPPEVRGDEGSVTVVLGGASEMVIEHQLVIEQPGATEPQR